MSTLPRRLALTLFLALPFPAAALAAPARLRTSCRNVALPVVIASQTGSVTGTLCTPPDASTVQLLVHGYGYNRWYWELPYQLATYSYVRAANRAGYATLAIDRPGAGASIHPPSLFDTSWMQIRVLHELVQALRHGTFGNTFTKVVIVGHSLGSLLAATEAGVYDDVDALVTTGFTHFANYPNVLADVIAQSEPADGDSRWANLDPLYFTAGPGTRVAFHNITNTDPAVLQLEDGILQDTTSLTQVATAATYSFNNADRDLNIPVLDELGDHDQLFCGLGTADCTHATTVLACERPWYGPQASVHAAVIHGSGHDIQLERTAPRADKIILAFITRYVGRGTGIEDTQPGAIPPATPTTTSAPSPADALLAQTFQTAVKPLAQTLERAAQTIPGLGDTTDPLPAARNLYLIGNVIEEILGTNSQKLLGSTT
jgi:pimeloyl-ACP methyl ester carboxylesterase